MMLPERPSDQPQERPRPGMDILPSTRRIQSRVSQAEPQAMQSLETPEETAPPLAAPEPQPIDDSTPQPKRRPSKAVVVLIIVALVAGLAMAGFAAVNVWYQAQLQPVSTEKNTRIRVTIAPGTTPDQIGKLLQEKKVIRSDIAFSIYTKDKGVQSKLQAGTFSLKPSDSLAVIVDHLVGGKTDEFSLTFLPGDTITGHKQVLLKAGYSEADVDAALKKTYDSPLFASKPSAADLEGYIYGETYNFTSDETVDQILTRTFDQFEDQVKKYDLVNAYQKQGLTLYQAITLASIIQREVATPADEKQVAQVFFKRLRAGGVLGSDVTFIYAAKKLGVEASPNLDSPYNTRKYPGLPPGPISSPGLSALMAVADPAPGDYSYFLAGDDGKTYYAHTYQEHEANIVNYCKKKCS